jgi:hypothetical protein
MGGDAEFTRYRRWYSRLLRLYPRPFHTRFAEQMTQTFADLCRERRDDGRWLVAFVLWTFTETSAAIIKEHAMRSSPFTRIIRWILITAAVLMVPFLAMTLRLGIPDPGSGTEAVDWGLMDFAIAGVLVFGSGLLFEYASTRARSVAYTAAVAVAVGASLILLWINLAVGMIGDEGNAANAMYLLVLAVALIGTTIARFEPREAMVAMVATAAVHGLVVLIALVAGLRPTLPADAVFIGLWLGSALLFRQASMRAAPSA